MPFDANLVLRGKYSDAYVDLDSSDAVADSVTVANNDGNLIVDLGDHGTGALGMDCIIILHDQPTTYTNYADFVIEDSDHLTDGWQTMIQFPRVYAYIREVICTTTTAFIDTDIGLVFTETGNEGIIIEFSRKLLTNGETGKVFVEMRDASDTYGTDGASLVVTSGTGRATQVGIGRTILTPLTLVRRFSTPKRYIRLGADAPNAGNFGDVDVLVTGSKHSHVNNLYR